MFRFILLFLVSFPIFAASALPPATTGYASNGTVVVQTAPGSTISNQIAQMTSPVTNTGANFGVNNTANTVINNIGSNASKATVAVKSTLNVAKTAVKDTLARAIKNKKLTPQAVVVDVAIGIILQKLIDKGLEWKEETQQWITEPLPIDVPGQYTCSYDAGLCGPDSNKIVFSSLRDLINASNVYLKRTDIAPAKVSTYGTCTIVGKSCFLGPIDYTWISVVSSAVYSGGASASDDDINSAVDGAMVDLAPEYLLQVADAFEPIDSSSLPMTAYVDPAINLTNAFTKWERVIPATESTPEQVETATEKSIVTAYHTIDSPAVGTGSKTAISYGVVTQESTSVQSRQQDGSLTTPVVKAVTSTTTTAQTKTTTDASGVAVADPDEADVPLVPPSANFPDVPEYPRTFLGLPFDIPDFITHLPWIPDMYSCSNPTFPYFETEFELPICNWIVKFRGLFEWFWNVLTAISIYLLIRSTNVATGGK